MIVVTKSHIMVREEEVHQFLNKFHAQMLNNEIRFYRHRKNFEALLHSELSARCREQIIYSLQFTDFYRGPFEDKYHPGIKYWEFGKCVKGKEWYIKISLGKGDGPVCCMSFHPSERKIHFPFKKRCSID